MILDYPIRFKGNKSHPETSANELFRLNKRESIQFSKSMIFSNFQTIL